MNIVSSILNRYSLNDDSKLNIVWTTTDQEYFTDFIKDLGHNLLPTNSLYFQNNFPHLIICNDRFSSYEKIKTLSIEYHLPIIIVDHQPKQSWIDDTKIKLIDDFPCAFRIAINATIYKSWKENHNLVLSYKPQDKNNMKEWNAILHNISKRIFNL